MESRVGEEELGEKSDTEHGWNPREEIVFRIRFRNVLQSVLFLLRP
jgi:hypothetical protein